MSKPAPRPELGGLAEVLQVAQTLLRVLIREHERVIKAATDGVIDSEVAAALGEVLVRRMLAIGELADELYPHVVVLREAKLLSNAIDGTLAGRPGLLEQACESQVAHPPRLTMRQRRR